MPRTLVYAAVAVLALAGCKKTVVDVKDAKPGDVARQVAASDLKPEPGRWEGSFKMEKMEVAGLPPQAQEAMQRMASQQAKPYVTCLTREELDKPNAGFFGGENSGCTYEHFTMAGGAIDAKMTCARGPGKVTTGLSGTYSPTSFAITSTATGDMPGGHAMTARVRIDSHRVGECRGDEDK